VARHEQKGCSVLSLKWNVKAILEALGGPQAFAEECLVRGWAPIAPVAIKKWRERSRIPSHGLAAAAMILHDTGPPLITFITAKQGSCAHRTTRPQGKKTP
jgi:hypothetical protein